MSSAVAAMKKIMNGTTPVAITFQLPIDDCAMTMPLVDKVLDTKMTAASESPSAAS